MYLSTLLLFGRIKVSIHVNACIVKSKCNAKTFRKSACTCQFSKLITINNKVLAEFLDNVIVLISSKLNAFLHLHVFF